MAAYSVTPYPYSDMVTLKECSQLFRETGHPASETTIRRWIAKYGLHTEREGRATTVSFTEILPVHRDEVALRD